MTAYVGIDGKARKIGAAYIGVDGVARKVVKAYVGVNGVAQLWWVLDEGGGPIVLEVEKITANTYAGETTYTGEQFILLDIYPKTNGTVKVTYGGLTKTITDTSGAESPNAQRVFFGTFNGVSDSVATPASGTLTIEGDCAAFGISTYQNGSKTTNVGYCSCITDASELGEVEFIPDYAFYKDLGTVSGGNHPTSGYFDELIIPATVRSIGEGAMRLKYTIILSSSQTNYLRSISKIVTVLAEAPPTMALNSYPFGNYSSDDFSIVVPKGCIDTYRNTEGWSQYYHFIVEAS